jgi:hypothetical protein
MGVELEDAAVVDAQVFPNGVPTLDRAVENGHLRLIPRKELASHMNENSGVSRVSKFRIH